MKKRQSSLDNPPTTPTNRRPIKEEHRGEIIFPLSDITNEEKLARIDYRLPAIITYQVDKSGKVTAAFVCDSPGLAGTTGIYVKVTPVKHEEYEYKFDARCGIALFGHTNDPDAFKKTPFDEDWYDNDIQGIGYTLEAALKKLEENRRSVHESLHYP